MQDWQKALEEVLKEKEKANQIVVVVQPKGQKRNRGRGAYPLQRLQVRAHPVVLDDEDGPEIYNWRKSPMEQ